MSVVRIKAGRILAGAKLDSIENAALVVAAGKIVAIETETDAGGHVIDLGTATMMPGMIDCHMHTFGVDSMRLNTLATEREAYRAPRALFELRQMLQAGFTSARCLGSTIGTEVRRSIDEGFATGPRLKVAGAFISSTSEPDSKRTQ